MQAITEKLFEDLVTCGVCGHQISNTGDILILAPDEAIELMQKHGATIEDVSFDEMVEHFKQGISELWY